MRVAIYGRQSNPGKKVVEELDDDRTLSIVTQIDRCKAFASALQADPIYDSDIWHEQITSEVFDDRPELQRMLAALPGRYDALVVYNFKRLCRDPNQLTALVLLLRSKGVRVLSATEPETAQDPMGDMILYIHGTFAKIEKIAQQKAVKDAKDQLISAGLLVGAGKARDGFKYEKHRRVINEARAKIVRRMFELIAGGKSSHQVAVIFNAESIPTVNGGRWHHRTIGDIVKDHSYYGAPAIVNKITPTEGRTGTGRRKRVRTKPDQHRSVGEATPAIVDRELWDRANATLEGRRRNRNRDREGLHPLWLRGHIFCGHCGGAMSAYPNNGKTWTWRCVKRVGKYVDHAVNDIKVAESESRVWRHLEGKLAKPEVVKAMLREAIDTGRPDWATQLEATQGTLGRLKGQVARLVGRFGDEDDPVILEALEGHLKTLREQVRQTEGVATEIEAAIARQRDQDRIVSEGLSLIEQGRALMDAPTFDDKVKLVEVLRVRVEVERIAVGDLPASTKELFARHGVPLPDATPSKDWALVVVTKLFNIPQHRTGGAIQKVPPVRWYLPVLTLGVS